MDIDLFVLNAIFAMLKFGFFLYPTVYFVLYVIFENVY